jgi:hypothetical protein
MAMDRVNKRSEALAPSEVKVARFSPQWFDDIDAKFLQGSRLFATQQQPFDRILPIARA